MYSVKERAKALHGVESERSWWNVLEVRAVSGPEDLAPRENSDQG